MPKLPLLAFGILAFAGLLTAAPAQAAGSLQATLPPFLCSANASPAPTVGAPAPKPVIFTAYCGSCSDSFCSGAKEGTSCLGPTFQGYRCIGDGSTCSDGLANCTCEPV